MHVLLTRPEYEARRMKAQLEASGHRVSLAPVLNIVPCLPDELNFHGVHALVITSANALRALERSPALARARTLPLFAVGGGTASVARRIGFANIHVGEGTGRALAGLIRERAAPSDGRLLYLAGETRAFDVAGALRESGFDVEMVVAYRAIASSQLPPDVVRDLGSGEIDTVILMSPRTARVFSELLDGQGLRPAARALRFICLSENVAAGIAHLEARRVDIAGKPMIEEILALANRMASVSGTSRA